MQKLIGLFILCFLELVATNPISTEKDIPDTYLQTCFTGDIDGLSPIIANDIHFHDGTMLSMNDMIFQAQPKTLLKS